MTMTAANPCIRPATPQDVPAILALIRELAAYAKTEHLVEATEAAMGEALFGEAPAAEALVAETDTSTPAVVGYAIFFHTFSTFAGRRGLWLEDLYVAESHRGRGIGKALLGELARIAVERDCCRVEWWALDWNKPARRFYESLGAVPKPEYVMHYLAGEPLTRLSDAPSA